MEKKDKEKIEKKTQKTKEYEFCYMLLMNGKQQSQNTKT
jgi:hypothetical protein